MTYRTRLTYTPELTSEIWSRYKQGDSLKSIARSIDRHSSCIYQILSPSGGIPPRETSLPGNRIQQMLRIPVPVQIPFPSEHLSGAIDSEAEHDDEVSFFLFSFFFVFHS